MVVFYEPVHGRTWKKFALARIVLYYIRASANFSQVLDMSPKIRLSLKGPVHGVGCNVNWNISSWKNVVNCDFFHLWHDEQIWRSCETQFYSSHALFWKSCKNWREIKLRLRYYLGRAFARFWVNNKWKYGVLIAALG
mgnify:CR=1 FL=1